MAERETEEGRSEPATPFKLQQARERGAVAKSAELSGVAVTLAFVALLFAGGQRVLEREARLVARLLGEAGELQLSERFASAWLSGLLVELLTLLAPLLGVIVLAGVATSFLQTGPVLSFEPLKPDFDRLNPASGLKRVFSRRLLFEAAKNLVKLALLGWVLYQVLEGLLPRVLGLAQIDPAAYPRAGLALVLALLFKLALVLLVVALLDLAYVRADYAERMRMSRREIREELKRREGDPKVKARIRELQREMRKRAKALRRVPEADVLITNPTHLAVALRYRREAMAAPQLLAKGAGELAERMRRIARRRGVPVLENKPLARGLFLKVPLEAAIPEWAYAEAARALAWAYALRARARPAQAAP